MAEYIEREADGFKYYVVRNKSTGQYFRGKGENKWGKYYNQASIYRFKKHAENAVVDLAHRGEQAEVVEIRIAETTADVFAVSHGRWIEHKVGKREANYTCSECGTMGSPQWKCCPVCTAFMFDGGVSSG